MRYDKAFKNDFLIITFNEKRIVLDSLDPVYKDFISEIKKENKNLILDLSRVEYLDSFAIGFIMDVFRTLLDSKRTLLITGINEKIATLFKVTRVNSVVKTYATIDEALKAIRE